MLTQLIELTLMFHAAESFASSERYNVVLL